MIIENHICTCPTCGHSHRTDEREISLYKGMVRALWRVFLWCQREGKHEFQMKEVRDLITRIEYARFGDWKKFGGLVYSPPGLAKGHYGLNLERCEAFFRGEYEVPIRVWKDPVTGNLRPEDYTMVNKVPELWKMLNEDGDYIARYRDAQTVVV